MMWIVAGVITASLAQQAASTLSVRLVDPQRSPLSGITVQIGEVNSCTNDTQATKQRSVVTKVDGSVEFVAVTGSAYMIVIESQGGLEGRRECLERIPSGPSYSQIELRPDLSRQVVSILPSIKTGSKSRDLVLGDFVGVYSDNDGRLYEVVLLDGEGLEVSLPEGGDLKFTQRRGINFHGPEGILSFRVNRGQVTGFSVARRTITTRKRN